MYMKQVLEVIHKFCWFGFEVFVYRSGNLL